MAADRRTRILIVDDSAVMRSLLRSIVSSDPSLEVAGTAADGATALACLAHTRPDLILLDVEMPVVDGLATLRELRRIGDRTPVIMCSSLTQRGARVTLDALAAGASDYVTKPAGQSDRETAQNVLARELIPRIHALACPSISPKCQGRQFHVPLLPVVPLSSREVSATVAQQHQPPEPAAPSVLAIGVSTGGPAALDVLLPRLPSNFPLPVLVVQHMPELFTRLLAERLNGRCRLPVREADHGDPVRGGMIYIARGNWHLETKAAAALEPHAGSSVVLRLSQGALENHCRPAVDVLFRSVAGIYGSGAIAVVMTGMGCDGLKGCRAIREHGGYVLAQDRVSSTVWGMPGVVAGAGLAQKILPLEALAPEILRMVSKPALRPAVPAQEPGRQAVL